MHGKYMKMKHTNFNISLPEGKGEFASDNHRLETTVKLTLMT